VSFSSTAAIGPPIRGFTPHKEIESEDDKGALRGSSRAERLCGLLIQT
jgi:hypothetical protein